MKANCTPECIDFITRWGCRGVIMIRLVAAPEVRMGRNGVEEIMNHPWLKWNRTFGLMGRDVDWKNLGSMEAPYLPQGAQ